MASKDRGMSWKDGTVGDLVALQRGYDLPERNRKPGDILVVGSAGPNGFHNEAKTAGPGITLGRSGGSIGKVTYVDQDFWPHNTCIFVTDFKGNHPRFIAYLLSRLNLASLNSGAAQPSLNRNFVYGVRLKYPDPTEQKRIADVLSTYDDLIENNRRRIQLLEESARLLYKEWFVHLRFPGHEHVTIHNGIPDGWEKTCIGTHASIIRGKSYRSSELAEKTGKPFVNLKCVARHGGFRLDGLKRFSGKYKEEQTVTTGDIIIAVTDMTRERHIVAHPARIPAALQDEAVFSMDIVKIIPKASVDSTWFYYFLRFSDFSKVVREHATGTNVLHLKPQQIVDHIAVFPSRLLQTTFSDFASNIICEQDNLELQNQQLRKARDVLLPRLMNGEIAV